MHIMQSENSSGVIEGTQAKLETVNIAGRVPLVTFVEVHFGLLDTLTGAE
jgi:hypothetical protein